MICSPAYSATTNANGYRPVQDSFLERTLTNIRAAEGSDVLNIGHIVVILAIMFGNFIFSDTPKNGIGIVVTGRHALAPARALARELARLGHEVDVVYTSGHWLDVDTVADVVRAGSFR